MSERKSSSGSSKTSGARGVSCDLTSKSKLSFYTHIACFAMIGCLVRLGTDHVMGSNLSRIEDQGYVTFKAFFSNMIGCFCLGLLSASSLSKTGKYAALYTGISTGLCGSITTYSKWNQQISLLITGETSTTSLPLVVAICSAVVGTCAALASLNFGKDVMTLLRRTPPSSGNKNPVVNAQAESVQFCNDKVLSVEEGQEKRERKPAFNTFPLFLLILCAFITTCLVVAILLGKSSHSALVTSVTVLMAPLGAGLRFALSKINKRFNLPVGTLLANALGSCLLALTHVIRTWVPLDCGGLAYTSAFGSGFLACLTTVSTFMSETSNKREKGDLSGAYLYLAITFVLCQVIAGLVNGVSHSMFLHSNINVTMIDAASC